MVFSNSIPLLLLLRVFRNSQRQVQIPLPPPSPPHLRLPHRRRFFFLTWLANFKLLLFAFDLGPLSPNPLSSIPLPLFIAVACLPIRTKQNQIPLPPKSPKLPLNLGTKIVIFSLLIGYMQRYRDLYFLRG